MPLPGFQLVAKLRMSGHISHVFVRGFVRSRPGIDAVACSTHRSPYSGRNEAPGQRVHYWS